MLPEFDRLVVTGANGWIGRAALSLAIEWWGSAAPKRVVAFGSANGVIDLEGHRFNVLPLTTLRQDVIDDAVVFHLAFLTKDRLLSHSGEEFSSLNDSIDSIVLDAIGEGKPRGVFVASSGAARIAEEGSGDRYGVAKLMQEHRFGVLTEKLGGSLLRGRIWSLAGPYMNKPEAYALANFLMQGRQTGKIHINSAEPVYRSYLHVSDLVTLILLTLLEARAPIGVTDLAGMEIVEMQDVAMAAARAVGIEPCRISRPPIDFGRRNTYVGNWAPIRELALACSIIPRSFADQVADTKNYFDKLGN